MKTLNDWQKEVHALAKEKGWWDTPKNPLEVHMLIVSEIVEATEEARHNLPPSWTGVDGKPEGELIELADVVIRILDYCEANGWDLEEAINLKHEYNKTRAYRHGGKKY